ncbi:3818_t:CDS:2, partial [Dentiscutata erythropus]
MSSKKQVKKTTLSNEQKKEIIKYKEKNPNISYIDLAAWIKKTFKLEVHSTTIGHLIKNKDDIEPTNDNDNELMEEMKANIEEILTLVTNIEPKNDSNNDNSENEDDSREISFIIYHEALNAIKVLEYYLMQQNLSDKDWLDHDQALLKLQKTIRKSRSVSFKQ